MPNPGSTRSRIIAFAAYDRRLRLELQRLPVRRAEDLEPGFEAARAARAQALLAYAVNVVFDQRNRVAELAIAQRLPSMSDFALIAHSGFLLSYDADVDDLARCAAGYVDRILKGARPAEMPVDARRGSSWRSTSAPRRPSA